jgi:hypothetical protein
MPDAEDGRRSRARRAAARNAAIAGSLPLLMTGYAMSFAASVS